MPPPKDDRDTPAPESPTRVAAPAISDDDSSADDTHVFQASVARKAAAPKPAVAPATVRHEKTASAASPGPQSSTRLMPPEPAARPREAATIREAPPGVVPIPPPAPSLSVSLVRAPLDDQGFGARYLPQGVLGEGGMGLIGLCKDVRIGREVAMKMLRKEAAKSDEARMRFEREARVQGQLEHPSIVPIYDLGVRPEGTPFFTMKRLHGETLSEIMDALQKGSQSAAAAYSRRKLLTAFSSVCLAVAFANARGVLHRDLKPSNVMLGSYGEVYLLDWGLAKLTGAADDDGRVVPQSAQHQTQVGEVMGTPGYMSPEQLRGEIDQLDGRTDVYSLGVLLFELLTLEPLHERKGLDTIYNSTLGKRDARITERAFAKGLPPELVAIVVKATALETRDRYATARDLHDAIERFLDGHRDSKQREEMAAQHAATALEASQLAATVPHMRELAMREVSAALALDPSHAGAVETLMRLMLDAPVEIGDEARQEFKQSRRNTERESRRGTLVSYLLWMCFVPIVLSLGVRDRLAAALTGGSVILAALLSWLSSRRILGGPTRFIVYCLGTLAIASTCTLMGWAIVVPGLAAVHTVGFIVYGEKRLQPAALVLGALSVVLPFVLQEAGVLPRAYVFQGDKMTVLPLMTSLPALRTQLYLVLASLAAIVVPAVVISRLRETLEAAEERAFMHAWTLQHLLPGRAREAAAALRTPAKEPRPPAAEKGKKA